MDALIRMGFGGWTVLGLKAGVGIAVALIIVDIVRSMLAAILDYFIGDDEGNGGRA